MFTGLTKVCSHGPVAGAPRSSCAGGAGRDQQRTLAARRACASGLPRARYQPAATAQRASSSTPTSADPAHDGQAGVGSVPLRPPTPPHAPHWSCRLTIALVDGLLGPAKLASHLLTPCFPRTADRACRRGASQDFACAASLISSYRASRRLGVDACAGLPFVLERRTIRIRASSSQFQFD